MAPKITYMLLIVKIRKYLLRQMLKEHFSEKIASLLV
jgi:hypothetical protein